MGPYDKPFSPQEYLMHYGVKGMKWGVSIYGVLFFIGWSLFSLVSKLNTSISIMSGIFVFVLSLILPIYLYDKYYSFFRSKRLKKIDKHSSHEE